MTKKLYYQPEIQIASIELGAVVLAGSVIDNSGAGKVNPIPTNDQW
jgi:hypothetical protein